ncbi:hypothetical protein FQR65_LT14580 [Abscondita terminalis]|nr:hypothetical protein FQR65_LT14580 [Abscondita terminalis]
MQRNVNSADVALIKAVCSGAQNTSVLYGSQRAPGVSHGREEARFYPLPPANRLWVVTPPSASSSVIPAEFYRCELLASCSEYRVAGNQFGLHKSTVCKILHEFVNSILEILTPKFLIMHTDEEAVIIANNFNRISNIPNIIGAIGGTHIPILPPTDGYRDFINRKSWASIVLQGVVDHMYLFRNMSVKSPGSTHGAMVFKTSNVYRYHMHSIPQSTVQVQRKKIPYVIIGDPAYSLLPWLLKGHSNNINADEDKFNNRLNSARLVVECAFGRLKSRWRTLLKRVDVHYTFVPKIVATCSTLHNLIEVMRGKFSNEWLHSIQQAEITFPQPQQRYHSYTEDLSGNELRDFFKNSLNTDN